MVQLNETHTHTHTDIHVYIYIWARSSCYGITFCCSSLDIFLREKVRKSCFIWLCRALKVLLNGPSFNLPRKSFLGKKVKKHVCYGITQN